MAKLTEFQKAITREHCIAVCKMLHFTLTEEQLSKLKFGYKYTWVTVEFRVKGYGYVSFAMDNHHSGAYLSGNKVTKNDISESLKIGRIDFHVWRFSDDEIKKREDQVKTYMTANFKKPSIEEFYEVYYSE